MNLQTIQGAEPRPADGGTFDLEALVAALNGGADPVPEAFARAFLGSIAPEDLAPLPVALVESLARGAYAHVRARPAGNADVQVFNPEGAAFTVVETVNDDMAFLFDSVVGELADRGFELKLAAHPILHVQRGGDGAVSGLAEAGKRKAGEGGRESLIHLHIDAIGAADRAQVKGAIEEVLDDVRAANEDFLAMRGLMRQIGQEMRAGIERQAKAPDPASEIAEACDLVDWLGDDNFIFLGARRYAVAGENLVPVADSGLGILRDPSVRELRLGDGPAVMTPEIHAFHDSAAPLIFTKASLRSRVHRRSFMDYVGIKTRDGSGALTGEVRIIGLLTSNAYTHSVREIPYLRVKADTVIRRIGLEPGSHSAKALETVLETYPRDDLFQIETETLLAHAGQILSVYDRPRVRVLSRVDRFERFVSALVYVPRERFDSMVRTRIGDALAKAYDGHVSSFTETLLVGIPLVRVHYIVGRVGGTVPQVDRVALEKEISAATLTWSDRLAAALSAAYGTDPEVASRLRARYARAFGLGYEAAFDIDTALADIDRLERLSPERPLAIDFYRRPEDEATRISLRLLSHAAPLPLSVRVPMLENMGLKAINERTYRITLPGADIAQAYLHDMTLERADGGSIAVESAAERLEDCLNAVLRGTAEDDGFNALVLDANLDWREAALIRTLGRYLRQAGLNFSQDYLWKTLAKHETIAADIMKLFHARFDPAVDPAPEARIAREAPHREAIATALAGVSSLDEDRILRRFVNLIDAAVRTSYYQVDAAGQPRPAIALKFESARVEGLPLPRPLYEIFVYAPRVEGVHLRFGKVARGGLRWSDRPQDFRTEVLGLVKAQQVKNAVIVPVGAKGGFVPKLLPAGGTREQVMAEGTAAYKLFVESLIDVTDNLKDGAVVHPDNTVRFDGDDPYLVVAADKGTATFSDTANAIATRRGFWLGDAFASGGSVGYDHKAMGITARGAWEAVKRHFREMDIDIQTSSVTCAGVGDMSGDVFGNAMLLSPALKLVAAFDHRHIFLDPDPSPAPAFAERRRLFDLPRSSWADYDPALISKGGGVFPRTAKSIVLPPEAKALLGFDRAEAAPNEIISAILRAKVDLLFFGGIGTYIRASTETDAAAGDRANDAVRIAAADIGAKVIGEGANLGMTQRSRIEAGRRGVRLNTDAIDNSAGVNTSDVEVNIKIALSAPVAAGDLSGEDRAALLKQMTPEVGHLVLRNNYLQTLALSLAEQKGPSDLAFQQRLMHRLEANGLLDRTVELLPSDAEIADRRSRGEALARPELAVLLAYAKLALNADLATSDVPDDPYLGSELVTYFPPEIEARFPAAIRGHRLRREIVATGLANAIINQGGPSCVARIADQTGADAAAIARAFAAVRDSYHLPELGAAIDALDNKVPGAVQLALYGAVQDLMVGRTIWFLGNVSFAAGLGSVVERYRSAIAAVTDALEQSLPEAWRVARATRIAELVAQQVPEDLARRLAVVPILSAASVIALLAETSGRSIPEVASTFFAAGRYFGVDDIAAQMRTIQAPDYYDRLALDRAAGQIETALRRIAGDMLATGQAGEAAVEAYVSERRKAVERMRATVHDIAASGLNLSKLTLAAGLMGDLVR